MNRLKRLIQQIDKRSRWRVLASYVVSAVIAYQLIVDLTTGLDLPRWFPGLAVVLFIVGLPLVVAVTLIRESGTTEPIKLVFPTEAGRGATRPSGLRRAFTWRNAFIGFVAALAIWGVVATGWYLLADRTEPEPVQAAETARRSIAVLPLDNLSPDPENEFFADGMHDEIITQLAKIADLKVISRTSVMEYKGRSENLRTIARELGVTNILEGTVRRADGRVRVTTQLIDALADDHLWAESYERRVGDVFAIQAAVAEEVATALRVRLTPEESTLVAARPTHSVEAYDHYLRGNNIWPGIPGKLELWQQKAAAYERAVEVDPTFAEAWAGLAETRTVLFFMHRQIDKRE